MKRGSGRGRDHNAAAIINPDIPMTYLMTLPCRISPTFSLTNRGPGKRKLALVATARRGPCETLRKCRDRSPRDRMVGPQRADRAPRALSHVASVEHSPFGAPAAKR